MLLQYFRRSAWVPTSPSPTKAASTSASVFAAPQRRDQRLNDRDDAVGGAPVAPDSSGCAAGIR